MESRIREIKEREEQIKKFVRGRRKFQETINQGIHILDEFIEEILEITKDI